ncbi:MAG: hypothetical protein QM757_24500 [Paludibaculum sp.]
METARQLGHEVVAIGI